MALFEFHIHNHVDLEEVHKKLDHIIKHQHEIMSALSEVKEQLAISDEKIDILVPAIEGVTADVAFIKAKLEAAGQGGIDAAGVAELKTRVQAQSDRLSAAATALSDLDAQTDPNAPEPEA